VDLRAVIGRLGYVKARTYGWFMKTRGLGRAEMIKYADSRSGCCFHMPDAGRALILVNEEIGNRGHARWTVCHELGHLELGHILYGESRRMGFRQTGYDVFEKEANCFARSFLAPAAVIRALGLSSPEEVSLCCGVSAAASRYIFQNVKNYGPDGTGEALLDYFEGFIGLRNDSKRCPDCGAVFFCKGRASFCPQCGREGAMGKCGPPYAAGGKTICAHCGHYGESAREEKYCRICGETRFAKCAGCRGGLVAGAAFCHICGMKARVPERVFYQSVRLNECPACGNERVASMDPACMRCGFPLVNHCGCCGSRLAPDAGYCGACGSQSFFGALCLFAQNPDVSQEGIMV